VKTLNFKNVKKSAASLNITNNSISNIFSDNDLLSNQLSPRFSENLTPLKPKTNMFSGRNNYRSLDNACDSKIDNYVNMNSIDKSLFSNRSEKYLVSKNKLFN